MVATRTCANTSFECLDQMSINKLSWPNIEGKFLVEENVNIVVQFNGKKRGLHQTKKGISEDDLVKEILTSEVFKKILKDSNVKKQIYITDRLINFII